MPEISKVANPRVTMKILLSIFIITGVCLSILGSLHHNYSSPGAVGERDGLDCGALAGPERYTCISNLAVVNEEPNTCELIDDTTMRDLCYWNAYLKLRQLAGGSGESIICQHISDPIHQYVCSRLEWRPHMLNFLASEPLQGEPDALKELGECNGLGPDYVFPCICREVAHLATADMDKARTICDQLGEDLLIGQCKFYIASAVVMDLKVNTSEKIDLLMDFCKEVGHPSWRSECYYLLADELALQSPQGHLDEIATACMESTQAIDYSCFDHVVWNLPSGDSIIEFCESMGPVCKIIDTRYKKDCWEWLGLNLARSLMDDIPRAIEICNRFPVEFRDYCLKGFSSSISSFNPDYIDDPTEGIARCRELPEQFIKSCFEGMGKTMGGFLVGNVSEGILRCENYPIELKEACFSGLLWYYGLDFGLPKGNGSATDSREGIKICNDFPSEFIDPCFNRLILTIRERFATDYTRKVTLCNQFPKEFSEKCLDSLE